MYDLHIALTSKHSGKLLRFERSEAKVVRRRRRVLVRLVIGATEEPEQRHVAEPQPSRNLNTGTSKVHGFQPFLILLVARHAEGTELPVLL